MRVSDIRLLYSDENNLLRMVRKRIYKAACAWGREVRFVMEVV